MQLVLFVLGLIFILGGGIYYFTKVQTSLAFLVFYGSVIVIIGYCVSWEFLSDTKTVEVVPHQQCEHTRTSRTIYIECDGLKVQTNNRYMYENYESNVEVPVEELGTKPDNVLAEKYGVSPRTICERRKEHGVEAYKRQNFAAAAKSFIG